MEFTEGRIPKVKLDQHFLIDNKIVDKIIEASEINSKDIILEIGAGKGVLTEEFKCEVIAVEIDKKFKKDLKDFNVIYGDVLKVIDKLKFNKIVGSIPYYISEPLFKKMIKLDFEVAVLLVGKNFYQVLNSESKWNFICGLFFNVTKILEVSRDSFYPKPKTNSVILKFKKRRKKLNKFEEIIKDFILQDDKKVKNALMYSLVRVCCLTKKEAIIEVYKVAPLNLLEKNVDFLSNNQFARIVTEIRKEYKK